AGPATRLIDATPTIGNASAVHSIPHLPTWHTDRMVVIGDAAHAPSPSSGQGASLAIEDAVVLAKCLRDIADPAEAFARYEEIRRPRVERIISNAAKVNSNKTVDGFARVMRDLFLPMILKVVAKSSHMEKTYGHRIDWEEVVSPTG
ncbi:MAG: FAD-dependent monooxygenase, partial [Acidimicrobiia bacterium]|nr:FAD-dependent monooxygenase [Acidimicrobiia bacterium]